MRAPENPQRAVLPGGVVQADTQRQNLFESLPRGTCIENGIFTDQGPQPGTSRRSESGNAVS